MRAATATLFVVALQLANGFYNPHHKEKRSRPACANCTRAAELRYAAIQKQILDALGLREPPNVVVTEEMRQFALKQSVFGHRNASPSEDSVYSIEILAHDDGPEGFSTASFRFSEQTRRRPLRRAVLAVHLRKPSREAELEELEIVAAEAEDGSPRAALGQVHVKVFERDNDGELGDIVASHHFTVPYSPEGEQVMLTLDEEKVNGWLHEFRDRFAGVYVEALYMGENLAIHPQDTDGRMKKPVLAMKMGAIVSRKRREAACTPDMKEKGCCLYDLFVDFKTMGWNFIIAPKRYNAYACSGDCSLANNMLDTAVHGRMFRGSIDRQSAIGGTCCHPSEYESLELIYTDQAGEVITATVPGMIANKCSCA